MDNLTLAFEHQPKQDSNSTDRDLYICSDINAFLNGVNFLHVVPHVCKAVVISSCIVAS